MFDTLGFIDSLIVDCSEIVKFAMSGQYVAFCAKDVEMVQRLTKLREGVEKDFETYEKELNRLRQVIKDINAAESGAEDV